MNQAASLESFQEVKKMIESLYDHNRKKLSDAKAELAEVARDYIMRLYEQLSLDEDSFKGLSNEEFVLRLKEYGDAASFLANKIGFDQKYIEDHPRNKEISSRVDNFLFRFYDSKEIVGVSDTVSEFKNNIPEDDTLSSFERKKARGEIGQTWHF